LVSVYSGRAFFKLYGRRNDENHGAITFADFLMLVLPRHKYHLNLEQLLTDQFRVYESDYEESQGTNSLVAQILSTHLSLIQ